MLKLPRKTMAALEAVLDIAYHARSEPVQSKEITRRQGIPQRYLEQVMQQFVHAGVLKGVRGPRGGYTLARERRRITLGELIRVIAAIEDEEDGADRRLGQGSELGARVLRPVWEEAQGTLMQQLDAITLDQLCGKARDLKIAGDKPDPVDFNI
jgi:Rrf2 family iron-sulfur cluster assembly transcriptional regulator